MKSHTLAFLFLSAWSCSTGRAPLSPDDYSDASDTGATDADADTDTDSDTDTDDELEPDFSVWQGMRYFEYDSSFDDWDCEDEVTEEGL